MKQALLVATSPALWVSASVVGSGVSRACPGAATPHSMQCAPAPRANGPPKVSTCI